MCFGESLGNSRNLGKENKSSASALLRASSGFLKVTGLGRDFDGGPAHPPSSWVPSFYLWRFLIFKCGYYNTAIIKTYAQTLYFTNICRFKQWENGVKTKPRDLDRSIPMPCSLMFLNMTQLRGGVGYGLHGNQRAKHFPPNLQEISHTLKRNRNCRPWIQKSKDKSQGPWVFWRIASLCP